MLHTLTREQPDGWQGPLYGRISRRIEAGCHSSTLSDAYRYKAIWLERSLNLLPATNRLLRQYLPKQSDLSEHSQAELNKIALQLNQRPRKTLGFRCPADKLDDVLR